MAVLAPADTTEANVAVTMQTLGNVGIRSGVADLTESNVTVTSISFGGTGIKSSLVSVDGLIDFTTIVPEESYQIVDS